MWRQLFFPTAFAQEDTSTFLNASSVNIAESSTTNVTTTIAPTTTLSIDTGAFQSIMTPSSSVGDILTIEISTDGVNWTPVTNIDQSNWQTGSYVLPIRSWDELQHLQVALVSLPTAAVLPQIYVDAIGVSVEYGDGGSNDIYISPATSTPAGDESSSSTSLSDASSSVVLGTSRVVATPAATPPPSAKDSFEQIFNPVAEQQCAVDPFSDAVAPGGSASFLLTLTPPGPAVSSSTAPTSTPSPAATPAPLYEASLGSLPGGISGHIVLGANGADTIGIDAATSTIQGSYTVIVVYKERQRDGTVLPNYCEFNLRVN